ncbi:MAG: ion transporter [Acidobacteriota bacterium]
MTEALTRFVEARWFRRTITLAILATAVVVGLETSPRVMQDWGDVLRWIDRAIIALFVVELVLKLGSHGSRPIDFFRNPWNVFDFVIVAVALLPLDSHYVAVVRLVRILRVLRLVTTLPQLQLLVGALLRSVPSMGYVGVLLSIHFYIYAVIGAFLFGSHDPSHFGSLGRALLTLFQVVTLEGWVELMNVQRVVAPLAAPAYFVTFIVVGGMIILNLFIGVIMNSMQESAAEVAAQRETRDAGSSGVTDEIAALEKSLDDVKKRLAVLRHRIQ